MVNPLFVLKLKDYDEKSSSPTWIHTEFAQKAKPSDFVKEFGGTLLDLINYTKIKFQKSA